MFFNSMRLSSFIRMFLVLCNFSAYSSDYNKEQYVPVWATYGHDFMPSRQLKTNSEPITQSAVVGQDVEIAKAEKAQMDISQNNVAANFLPNLIAYSMNPQNKNSLHGYILSISKAQNVRFKTKIVHKLWDSPAFYSRLEKIINKNQYFQDTVALLDFEKLPLIRNKIRMGFFSYDELAELSLSDIQDHSHISDSGILVAVLAGHTNLGDYIEIVNFPQEKKIIYRIEVLQPTNILAGNNPSSKKIATRPDLLEETLWSAPKLPSWPIVCNKEEGRDVFKRVRFLEQEESGVDKSIRFFVNK